MSIPLRIHRKIETLPPGSRFHALGHVYGRKYEDWKTPETVRLWWDGHDEYLDRPAEEERRPHISTVIPGKRWSTYFFNDLSELPDAAGVYVAYSALWPVYVGQSVSVFKRWQQHSPKAVATDPDGQPIIEHRDWGRVGEFRLKVRLDRRFGERLMREARLIRRIKPRFNSGGGGGGSPGLHADFTSSKIGR